MMILANAGTPLMWASMLWLFLGNLFIGLIEGAVLAKLVRTRSIRPYVTMIAANYFSAWVAYGVIQWAVPWLDRTVTVTNFFPVFALLLVAAWAWSVLLEYPFVWWAFPKRLRRFRWLPWRASAIVQTLSYVGLIVWFGSCSSISLVTKTHPASAAEIAMDCGATVYYATPDGTQLRRVRLDGTQDEPVAPMREEKLHAFGFSRLCIRPSDGGYVIQQEGKDRNPLADAPAGPWCEVYAADEREGWHFRARVMPGSDGWSAEEGFWALQGLTVERGGQSEWLSMETPFTMWYVRSATVLSGGRVVFECGQQVLLYDAPTKRLALLAKGRVPLVIPDTPPPAGFRFPDLEKK